MLNLPSSSALALVLLASLASTVNAQCFNNNPKENDGDCDDDGGNWNNGYTVAVVIAITALLVFLLLYTAIIRRRRYALSQHPAVKPPMFGTAPPPGYAYTNGLPFWNPNANRAPAPAYEAEMAPPAYPYGKAVGEGGKAGNEGVYDDEERYAGAGASTAGPYAPPAGPYVPPAGPPPPPQAHTAGEHGYVLQRQQ